MEQGSQQQLLPSVQESPMLPACMLCWTGWQQAAAGLSISLLRHCPSTVRMPLQMLLALVPAGSHIVTTTDCYFGTRNFIQTVDRIAGACMHC